MEINSNDLIKDKDEFLTQLRLRMELLRSNIIHKDNKIKLLQQSLSNAFTRIKTQEGIIQRLEERGKLLETIYDENQKLLKAVDHLKQRDHEKDLIIGKLEDQIYELNKYTELSQADFMDQKGSLTDKIGKLQVQSKELEKYSTEKEEMQKDSLVKFTELERKIEDLDMELMKKDSEILYLQDKMKDEITPKKKPLGEIPIKVDRAKERYLFELRKELKTKNHRIFDLENQVKQLSVLSTGIHSRIGFHIGKIIPSFPVDVVDDFVEELIPVNERARELRIKEIRDMREFNKKKF